MVKRTDRSVFVCNECGHQTATWSGRCPNCGQWNTLEERLPVATNTKLSLGHSLNGESITKAISTKEDRLKTGLSEIDAVFGGGLVRGSVNLIAGQPGIGKSTLLMQLASSLAASQPVLYVSGEESVKQLAMRAKRLKITAQKLELATTNSTDDIASTISGGSFSLVIIDSIQTVALSAIASASGSVAQITNSTSVITQAAKTSDCAVMLVGHVTKEGHIAGPKLLEHAVDVVMQLEGEKLGGFKILRATKNRFGSINEAAILEMTDDGLLPIANPSATLLKERRVTDGSIVHAAMEGSRPLLVEIQALVSQTSYGYPKRTASGFDLNRLNLLIAMLERRTKLSLSDKDIYLNVVGGLHLKEPAADLAVSMAIASAATGHQLKADLVVFGEVGLSGEVRHVPFTDKRLDEASKLGFKGAIGPSPTKKLAQLYSVTDVRSALNQFLEK